MFVMQVMNLIGDVKGKVAVMVDDMIDTAGMPSSMPNLKFEDRFFFQCFLFCCTWCLLAGLKKSS